MPQDAAFPHVWTIGQQHWNDTFLSWDPRWEIPTSTISIPINFIIIFIFLSDLGAYRFLIALETSPTRYSSAAHCTGRWLWAACSGDAEQGPQSRVLSTSQKSPLASLCVTQICASKLLVCLAASCLAREARLLSTILVLKSGFSDSPLHSGQLFGVWSSSQQRYRQGRQKLCPQSMVTGSMK